MTTIPSSDITPEQVYRSRRQFIAGAGALLAATALAACGREEAAAPAAQGDAPQTVSGKTTDELGNKINGYEAITTYNNYYEFSTDKEGVAPLAKDFKTSPWTLTVGGMVNKPKTYAVEDLIKQFGEEERIYRLRCVEAWSMVIPWMGFPLAKLLADVEPTAQAKFVRFEGVYKPEELPGQGGFYTWPYVEGLRLDEAMNDLALIGTGLYGKSLPTQNGAPLRLVVPWKYGFKSIKAITKIELVDKAPVSLWMAAASNEYGFYANVNPEVSHPRWSQSTERRIGEFSRRETLMFNGYADQVASLYKGMDLQVNF